MGAVGPNPVSRLAGWNPVMPAANGYHSVQEFMPAGFARPLPGPIIGTAAPPSTWIGAQWAPGQGGDTPGGGGAAMAFGQSVAVQTAWIVDGYVIPQSQQAPHNPGWVSWVGSRRSSA